MQKLNKVFIIGCFSWSDVDTYDKGLTLTSNAWLRQTSSARVPVCFSGEKNCVVRLNQMVSRGFFMIAHNTLETSDKRKSLILQFSNFCQWQIAWNYHKLATNLFMYWLNYPWRNHAIIDMFLYVPSRITAESIKSFELEHNKGPFSASDTFPHERKQSQTSAHDD